MSVETAQPCLVHIAPDPMSNLPIFYERCTNCGWLSPTDSVVCKYCSVSLGRYRTVTYLG